MSKRYNPRSVLETFSEGLTFAVMVGLTVASAAAYAYGPASDEPQAAPVRLPTVVVTAKRAPADIPRLPLVVVSARR